MGGRRQWSLFLIPFKSLQKSAAIFGLLVACMFLGKIMKRISFFFSFFTLNIEIAIIYPDHSAVILLLTFVQSSTPSCDLTVCSRRQRFGRILLISIRTSGHLSRAPELHIKLAIQRANHVQCRNTFQSIGHTLCELCYVMIYCTRFEPMNSEVLLLEQILCTCPLYRALSMLPRAHSSETSIGGLNAFTQGHIAREGPAPVWFFLFCWVSSGKGIVDLSVCTGVADGWSECERSSVLKGLASVSGK